MELILSWQLWLILAGCLVVIELCTNIIATFCLAAGCVAACLAALCGASVSMQLLFLAVGSTIAFILIPPMVKRHREGQPEKHKEGLTNMDALIGREVSVIEPITASQKGRVKIDGDNWQAVSADPTEEIGVGARVKVVSYDSIVLTVETLEK